MAHVEHGVAAGGTRPFSQDQIRAWVSVAWVVIATLVLGVLAFSAHTTPYFGIDLVIARTVQSVHDGWFDLLMQAISWPGFPPQLYIELVLLIALLFFTVGRWEAFCVTFASVGLGGTGLLIKIWVNRPRPSPSLIHVLNPSLDGGKYSFTAGHVESYVAILGFLWFLAFVSHRRSIWRTLVLVILGAMIALIGLSRVYSGEHWFSDVVGGYLFGSLWLIATVAVYRWGQRRSAVASGGVQGRHTSGRSSLLSIHMKGMSHVEDGISATKRADGIGGLVPRRCGQLPPGQNETTGPFFEPERYVFSVVSGPFSSLRLDDGLYRVAPQT